MKVALARIRILVANQPRLMRESVTCTVADQEDVEIVGQADDVEKIPDLIEETRPDCVIISPEKPGERPHICDALLGLYPNIKILAVTSESNSGFLYWSSSVIHSIRVECSAEGILSALRGKMESRESKP
jgi:DNA-binding NarL/FixJ family response regulator